MAFPDSQEVVQALESSENEAGSAEGEKTDLAPEAAPAPITELDKLEKFKFDNQEYTPQELKRAILRQQDYTRKTQEFSQERRFYDNLNVDLRSVRTNPALASEFRRIYPEKFHSYLEYISNSPGKTDVQEPQKTEGNQTKYAELDPALISRFERVENTIFEKEVQAIEMSLEAQEKTLGAKYDMADPEVVYSKAQALLDKNSTLPKDEHVKLTPEVWEKIYKADHEKNQKRYESRYKENVNKQKQAGLKARDSGSGGGSPSDAPKKYKNIREATEAAIAEIDSQL